MWLRRHFYKERCLWWNMAHKAHHSWTSTCSPPPSPDYSSSSWYALKQNCRDWGMEHMPASMAKSNHIKESVSEHRADAFWETQAEGGSISLDSGACFHWSFTVDLLRHVCVETQRSVLTGRLGAGCDLLPYVCTTVWSHWWKSQVWSSCFLLRANSVVIWSYIILGIVKSDASRKWEHPPQTAALSR